MRSQILAKLHRAHSGVENTLKLARDAVFWPSMSADIKDLIMSCPICAKFLPSQQRLPMQSHIIPEYPFQIVSMDVFFMTENGKQNKYLVTVDHYSDFFELDKLRDLSAKAVIEICKRNFARHGIPEVVCTDGGTNFVCQDFAEFSVKWNFNHVTSSPHHHQGNGKAEATVKIAKKLLMKSIEAKEDVWLSLLCLRNTPNKLDTSPVQRLYSRRTRGSLPVLPEFLKPAVVQNVSNDIIKKRERVKHQYDKRARQGTALQIGQPVMVQLQPAVNKYWTPGSIQDVLSDRSYLVKVNGAIYRRDLVHIRPSISHDGIQASPHVMNTETQSLSGPIISTAPIASTSNLHSENEQVTPLNYSDAVGIPQNESFTEIEVSSPTQIFAPIAPSVSKNDLNEFNQSPYQNVNSSRPKRHIVKPRYLSDFYCED